MSLPTDLRLLEAGKRLAHSSPGEEIVISGISGRFPCSKNINIFQENLFNKVDMVTKNRWNVDHPEIPGRAAHLGDVSKFDCAAFGIHPKQADAMGPLMRNLLEVVFEAIYDAGINPQELEGTRIGVFVPTFNADCQEPMVKHDVKSPKEAYGEMHRFTSANLISYILKLDGPSCSLDSGCSASLYALQHAYRAMRRGEIDGAIVGGAMLNLHPAMTMQCVRQGVLSRDGRCKTFDERADGYVKAETVAAIFVQKLKDARRVYSEVKHCKVGCDGYKEEGIAHPSSKEQQNLFSQLYEECGVDPVDVSYVEAHGTGTKAGDLQETTAIDNTFSKGRSVIIGSVKTNMGHAEQIAGLCQITKAITIMETGLIPPNLNYQETRRDIDGLHMGRLKVLTESAPLPNQGLLAINSFGIGGSNAHLLLKAHDQVKANSVNDGPRLVCVSGRTHEAVETILKDITSRANDVEFLVLLNDLYQWNIPTHRYRGTIIFSQTNSEVRKTINKINFFQEGLCLILGNFSSNLLDLLRGILELHMGRLICTKVSKILQRDFTKLDPSESKENQHLLAALTQIVFVCLCKILGVSAKIVCVSLCGVFAKAYAKNTLSFEEAVFFANFAITTKLKMEKFQGENTLKLLKTYFSGKAMKTILKYSFKSHKVEDIPIHNRKLVVLYIGGGKSDVKEENNFLETLSRIYEQGLSLNVNILYDTRFIYPIGKATPKISPLIKWDHSKSFSTLTYKPPRVFHKVIRIDTNDARWNFVHGHTVYGTKVFPGLAYVYLAWETMAFINGKTINEIGVVLEDVKFTRFTVIPHDGVLEFLITLERNNGRFTVFESGSQVLTGKIFLKNGPEEQEAPEIRPDEDFALNQADIYKEMHLRGYGYWGLFRGVQNCNTNFTRGLIQWHDNWVAFLDNILQLYCLSTPTRNLLVPSHIQTIIIDPKLHRILQVSAFPCNLDKGTNTIRCGGVTITDANANAMHKTASVKTATVSEHKFVPNETSCSLEESVSINMQIAIEITHRNKIKVVEIADGEEPLLPIVIKSVTSHPLVDIEAILLTKDEIKIPGVRVENTPLTSHEDVFMVIKRQIPNEETLKAISAVLREDGFILTRDSFSVLEENALTIHNTPLERLVFTMKSRRNPSWQTLQITNDFAWIKPLQDLLSKEEEVILYTQSQDTGILGFTKSIRREGENVRCVTVCEHVTNNLKPSSDFYSKQLKKGHVVNVFKNGKWGTYRCLPLERLETVKSEQRFLKGDQKWCGNATMMRKGQEGLIQVYYSGLNHKDFMIARNKLQQNLRHGPLEEPLLGLEYSGKLEDGRRVMGICPTGGSITTLKAADKDLVLEVPQQWTLEEAATIPCAYTTALYALSLTKITKDQTILIDCAMSDVGQAAINVCYSMGLNIFAVANTEEEVQFLQHTHPFLKASQTICFDDSAFERLIKRKTKGRGVDVVVFTSAGQKQKMFLRCLANKGTFLEVQNHDPLKDTPTPLMDFARREIEFHSIFLEKLLETNRKHELMNLLRCGLQSGMVKPLQREVFEDDRVDEVFRSTFSGRKVLIKIRDEQADLASSPKSLTCTPRYYPEGSIVVTGGLGGFGMELIDWLVNRGAKAVVIAARTSNVGGYEASRLEVWKQKGVQVKVTTDDITTEEGCKRILEEANTMAPLGSIFHLAVKLGEALFEHQTVENFQELFAVKAQPMIHFDKLSRAYYSSLRDLVVFSSMSSVTSNPGQNSYVYANSVTERICEIRRKDNLPALAVQWGIVGDVGSAQKSKQQTNLIADLSGLESQSITNCLEVLEDMLIQKPIIASSGVFRDKTNFTTGERNIVTVVANIMGLRDLQMVGANRTLAELGMDSFMATVIKQTLQREFEVTLSHKELRRQTFAGLEKLRKRTD